MQALYIAHTCMQHYIETYINIHQPYIKLYRSFYNPLIKTCKPIYKYINVYTHIYIVYKYTSNIKNMNNYSNTFKVTQTHIKLYNCMQTYVSIHQRHIETHT